jgi:hypothetical protein
MQKIDSVAGPERTEGRMSESVHRSSMEGGDANPDKSRSVIKNFPMFSYPPVESEAKPGPNGIPAEEVPSVVVAKEKVEAAKEKRAKEEEAAKKALEL